jgi:hypothetical protein
MECIWSLERGGWRKVNKKCSDFKLLPGGDR